MNPYEYGSAIAKAREGTIANYAAEDFKRGRTITAEDLEASAAALSAYAEDELSLSISTDLAERLAYAALRGAGLSFYRAEPSEPPREHREPVRGQRPNEGPHTVHRLNVAPLGSTLIGPLDRTAKKRRIPENDEPVWDLGLVCLSSERMVEEWPYAALIYPEGKI